MQYLVFRILGVVLVVCALHGCVSRTRAKAEARKAFLSGQQQAMMLRSAQPAGPSVTIVGPVKNPSIPWRPDLTLAKAIVDAGYAGTVDPRQIMIVRNGQAVPVDPKTLLAGEDVPLLSGDMVIIQE